MRVLFFFLCFMIAALPGRAETITAYVNTVGCTYHDVLWDKTGYDEDGRPTSEMLALDVCTGITTGEKVNLFEQQLYAPGGLKIVRIKDKLYFVRARDFQPQPVKKAATADAKSNAKKVKNTKKTKVRLTKKAVRKRKKPSRKN